MACLGGTMKRSVSILFLFAAVLNAKAATITVGNPKQFVGLQRALAIVKNGDTILVKKGLYRVGNLAITKSIVLLGENFPILDGEHKYEVISVRAPSVVISGFVVKASGQSSIVDFAGIKIYNTRDVVVQNNILEDNFFGIYSQYGTHCTITGNRIRAYGKQEQQSGNGIHCWKSDSLLIGNNTINGHRDGIYFEFVTHSLIDHNVSSANLRYGLHFMFSNNDLYTGNRFSQNGAGVAVMFSKNVSMLHNRFENNWGDAAYGLLLKEISGGDIRNNIFSGNTMAVFMEGASRITVQQNTLTNNGWAMKIQASCMEIRVNRNNFTGNSFDIGTNGTLVLNDFDGNYWDKYEGYDLNHDHRGDLAYHPVSMYAVIAERNPPAMILFRSFITALMDRTEKLLPSLTPEALKDNHPFMKPFRL
jgi:nitrous oxidase accessory protein